MLLSFIYFHRQCVIRFRSEGHRWAWGELYCCHSFIFNANVSFISKVRATGGLGMNRVVVIHLFSMSMCHSFQKVRVTGGP